MEVLELLLAVISSITISCLLTFGVITTYDRYKYRERKKK